MYFDVDHFKAVNDDFGHLAGDHVLKEVAQLAKGRVRPDDVLARYGGEELAIILPETDLDVTISCGVAELDRAWSAYDFVKAADEQLYEAKRAGRNRVHPV